MKTIACLGLLAALLLALPARGEADPPSDAEDLIRREQIRSRLEEIFKDIEAPPPGSPPLVPWITERVVALGPDVAPLLEAELENKSPYTFHIACYALGLMNAPGAEKALRAAAETAIRAGGDNARGRMTWVAYALALLGEPDAVDLLDGEGLQATWFPFLRDKSALETVAVILGPAALPRLRSMIERGAKEEDPHPRFLPNVLNALRLVPDPSVRDLVVPLLDHELPYVRRNAALLLAAIGDQSIVDRLIAGLDDSHYASRSGKAMAIEELLPKHKTKELLARLETEEELSIRRNLYRTLAQTGGESVINGLAKHWGRPDPEDRMYFVEALGMAGTPKVLNLLREAVKDSDPLVVFKAESAMLEIGGPGVMDSLLAYIRDPRWSVAMFTIRLLVEAGEQRAAPRIADRLLEELESTIREASFRDVIRGLGEALVELGYTAPTDDIRRAMSHQVDPLLLEYLESLTTRLRLLEENREDVEKWAKSAAAPDPEVRKLAFSRLARLDNAAAARVLNDEFGRVEAAEGLEILRAIGRARMGDAQSLLERVITDPAFDAPERGPLRDMAAWAASQVGGERMAGALRRSAERRGGLDTFVLIYLATLTGSDTLPLIQATRVPRLRHWDFMRGVQLDRLDRIVRELSAGRSIEFEDRPPDEIPFR